MNYKQNNKSYINLVMIEHHHQRPTAGYRPVKLSETGILVYIPTVTTLLKMEQPVYYVVLTN